MSNTPLFPLGATVDYAGVHYHVWAPQVREAAVEIFSPARRLLRTVALADLGGGHFAGRDEAGKAGDLYKNRLAEAGSFPDPASRWQPDGVHGPSQVIDPHTYEWHDGGWQRTAYRDLVIYELHVGAFSQEGTFRSAIPHLQHVKELGANAIELLPVADFDGTRNWGYDGVCLYAPSRAYGHPDDMRALVDAAHGLGLTVILDVVYNHFGPAGNYLHAYIGQYLDESTKTPWGGAIQYGKPEFKTLRDWVAANPEYWMREFHVDGFRLDATHAIFDDSPRPLLQELTGNIHARGGFAIAEDPRNDVKLVKPEAQGGYGFDGVWADDFHHIVRVANTHEDEGYLGDFQGTLEETVDVLRHGWFYRGQHAPSEGAPRGTECLEVPPQCFVHCISNHDQTGNHAFGERLARRMHPAPLRAAEALLCLTPHTPLLFMGQEWSASTPFLFFTDHHPDLGDAIVKGRREEFSHFKAFSDPALLDQLPHPQAESTFLQSKLRWDECAQGEHAGILALYKACLALRASDPMFRPTGRETWRVEQAAMGVGLLRLQSEGGDWLVIFDLEGGHEGSLREESICEMSRGGWEVVLFSGEARFGGPGKCAVDPQTMQAKFSEPETVVLRAVQH